MNKTQYLLVCLMALVMTACGGGRLSPLPPDYKEPPSNHPVKPKTSKKTAPVVDASNTPSPRNNTDSQISPEPVIPKVEPIDRGTSKPYSINGNTYQPMKKLDTFTQTGVASWYGKKFHGRRTANGEVFDMYKFSAAHKTLPLPSYIKITNLDNNLSTIVRVNDRGPFVSNRILDLSYAAAKKLDVVSHGTANVKIALIDPNNPDQTDDMDNVAPESEPVPSNTPTSTVVASNTSYNTSSIADKRGYFVQVGAFKVESNADNLINRFQKELGDENVIIHKVYNNDVYQVVLGTFPDFDQAQSVAAKIRNQMQLTSLVFSQ